MEILLGDIYRELKPGSTRCYNYFIFRKCNKCGLPYYAKKSGIKFSLYCSVECSGKVRGRPVGHILSAGTKQKIAEGRAGKKHSAITKLAIQESIHQLDYSLFPKKKIYRSPENWVQLRTKWRANKPTEWSDFAEFYEWVLSKGWAPGLVISRINKNKPFGPDNVLIRTKSEHSGSTIHGRQDYI